jgi:hypothetical protein
VIHTLHAHDFQSVADLVEFLVAIMNATNSPATVGACGVTLKPAAPDTRFFANFNSLYFGSICASMLNWGDSMMMG